MSEFRLQVITPRKIVKDEIIQSITTPSADGMITILPRHTRLLTLLVEGIVLIKRKDEEEFLAIGGGYLETDGKLVRILVSRAYGQDEINHEQTELAMEEAKNLVSQAQTKEDRQNALSVLRRSVIDSKLIKKRRKV